jgi:hypothetical protein
MLLFLLLGFNVVLAVVLVRDLARRPDLGRGQKNALVLFAIIAPLILLALFHRRIWPGPRL